MQDIRLGQNIAALRKNHRLTQEQLAQALHISAQAVSKWENNLSVPDTITIPQIAEYFHVSIDFLYYGKAEPMQNENKIDRSRDSTDNVLIWQLYKEEDLASLTDEEFAVLQAKLKYYKGSIAGVRAAFGEFYEGFNHEEISGNGTPTDFCIYKRKSMADKLPRIWSFYRYERLFTLARTLDVRNFYDLGCRDDLQASLLVYDPERTYTGVDPDIFHDYWDGFHAEPEYVNKVFERFTGSGRIRYIKDKYPCPLDVSENNLAIVRRTFRKVEEAGELFGHINKTFERITISLADRRINPVLRETAAKDFVYADLPVWEDIFEEELLQLKKAMPKFEFFRLGTTFVFGTKIPSDREKLEKRYILVGDRLLSDIIDRHWIDEMTK